MTHYYYDGNEDIPSSLRFAIKEDDGTVKSYAPKMRKWVEEKPYSHVWRNVQSTGDYWGLSEKEFKALFMKYLTEVDA